MSTRGVLASADAAIARVRDRLAADTPPAPSIDADTAAALRLADDWSRALDQLIAERTREEATHAFRQRWPALVRWRDRTIANWRRERPADVAAAYELVALECYLGGIPELAEKAQAEAVRVLMVRTDRRVRPGVTGSPAEARSA